MSATAINWFHVFFSAPIIGYAGYKSLQGEPMSNTVAIGYILLAVLVLIYHLYLVAVKMEWIKGGMQKKDGYQRRPVDGVVRTY